MEHTVDQTSSTALTILLVEDHDDTRDAMKARFEAAGHTVLVARNLQAALALGRRERFDVLFTDVQLPDGDGWTLPAKLSAANRSVVAVAISGHCSPADFAQSKGAGFTTYLIKPFVGTELEAALETARQEVARRAANGK